MEMDTNYINDQLLKEIANNLKVTLPQINAVLNLINDGATVPFIARYRKEVTGGLDEKQIRAIYQEWDYGQKLAQRKEDVMRLIEEKGKLTDEIRNSIIAATKLAEVEDIYRPYKEKKKTRATEAKKKGLEPLAEFLLTFPTEGDVLAEAAKYVTKEITEEIEKEGLIVKDENDALQGAKDIIAEIVSDEPKYRTWLRKNFNLHAKLKSEVRPNAEDPKKVYEMYYDFEEPIRTVKLYRVLAINRGEAEKVLKVQVVEEYDQCIAYLNKQVIKNEDSLTTSYVLEAIEDGYKRLIKPSIEREIRTELKEKAEDQAIQIFGENLRNYLLQPPMKGKVVLGIDPAYRTGCKLAVVDATGKFLEKGVIYPNQRNKDEVVPQFRLEQSRNKIIELVNKYNVEVICIGNGTASRETEAFVAETIKAIDREVFYIIVNEAGASVYSTSKAQEEFPDFEVEEDQRINCP